VGKANVPVYRIQIVGLGKDKPVNDQKTRADRSKNRRVEVTLFSAGSAASAAAQTPGSANWEQSRAIVLQLVKLFAELRKLPLQFGHLAPQRVKFRLHRGYMIVWRFACCCLCGMPRLNGNQRWVGLRNGGKQMNVSQLFRSRLPGQHIH